jgi:catechol-2,3-dioxygenase
VARSGSTTWRGSSTRSTSSPRPGHLLEAGAYTGESSHGATKSVYGADPDGNEFELMWMLPRAAWGDYEHAAVIEHLDWQTELERWSGIPTASELSEPLSP